MRPSSAARPQSRRKTGSPPSTGQRSWCVAKRESNCNFFFSFLPFTAVF
jgi:hypothetical protein